MRKEDKEEWLMYGFILIMMFLTSILEALRNGWLK
jgi:hypothetical protein